jgi:hypothetical protein
MGAHWVDMGIYPRLLSLVQSAWQKPAGHRHFSLSCGIHLLADCNCSRREFITAKAVDGIDSNGGTHRFLFVAGLGRYAGRNLDLDPPFSLVDAFLQCLTTRSRIYARPVERIARDAHAGTLRRA